MSYKYSDLISANNSLIDLPMSTAKHEAANTNLADFTRKGRRREYFPSDYAPSGTDLECRRALGCTMTAGSTTVTAPSGVFEAGIVGKKIKISACGTNGNDLVTTVTARASASSITVADAASGSAPAHDRVVYWGTDCTTYIQAAINDAYTNGKVGIVVFEYMMVVAGPLVRTSADASSDYICQIYLPFQSYADAERGGIELVGDHCMQYSDNGPGNVGYTRPSMNAGGIVSFLTTSVTGAAVIATGGPTSGAGTYNGNNYSNIQIRKLKILVPTNSGGVSAAGAGIGGINMTFAVNHQIYECIVGIDDNLGYSLPSTAEHVGVEGNAIYTDALNEWSKINVYGFHAGFRISTEHMRATSLQAYGCYDAFQIKEGMFTLYGDSWIMHWGKNFMRVLAGPNNKDRFMYIVNCEVEALNSGNHPITGNANWTTASTSGFFLDDSGGRAKGVLMNAGTFSGGGVGIDSGQLNSGIKIIGPYNVAGAFN